MTAPTRAIRLLGLPILFVASLASARSGENPAEGISSVTPANRAPGNRTLLFERAHDLARLGVDRWHAALVRGQGVRVAILDSGFRGYRAFLGSALPTRVQVRSFRSDGDLEAKDSQHGILCGEVVHAIAPEAELLFANWEPDRPDQFLSAARWARNQGARILSCSLIMPSWSDGEGGGPIHATLSRILGSGSRAEDLLCFACAGNIAQRHWAGTFSPGPKGLHAWKPDRTGNRLSPWGREQVSVEMYWRPGPDYELCVRELTTGTEVGRSPPSVSGSRSAATVRFDPEPGRDYQVLVQMVRGPAGAFHLAALGAELEIATTAGSVSFPADGTEVIAVGAVDEDGHRIYYSACGPNSTAPKPDLVAPVPFTSFCRSRPFSGTSASAPQAAALAALWLSQHPDWNAARIRDVLARSACDLGPIGHDRETGYGLIRMPSSQSAFPGGRSNHFIINGP